MKMCLLIAAFIIAIFSIVIMIRNDDEHDIKTWCKEHDEVPKTIESTFTGFGTPFKYKLKNDRIYIVKMANGKTFYFRKGRLFEPMIVKQ